MPSRLESRTKFGLNFIFLFVFLRNIRLFEQQVKNNLFNSLLQFTLYITTPNLIFLKLLLNKLLIPASLIIKSMLSLNADILKAMSSELVLLAKSDIAFIKYWLHDSLKQYSSTTITPTLSIFSLV